MNALQWDAVDAAVTYIGLDTRLESLRDTSVRQALNYGLDKDAVVAKLTYELGKRATTMYPPSSWAYEQSVNAYPYDPNKARQLLDAAGWKVGAGDVRYKDGQPLKLLFLYGPNTTPVREQLATVAQQQCATDSNRLPANGRAMSCKPNGSPHFSVRPAGSESAGIPVKFAGAVRRSIVSPTGFAWQWPAALLGRTTRSWSMSGAGSGVVGVASRSTAASTKACANRCWSNRRTRLARAYSCACTNASA